MNKRIPILFGFILLIIAVWLSVTSYLPVKQFLSRLENLSYDMQLQTRVLTHPVKATSPIAIIDVDDKSLAEQGHWPWPRSKVAQLISRLQEDGAAVIAMDMTFPEAEDNITQVLAQQAAQNKLTTPQLTNVLQALAPSFDHDLQFAQSLKKSDTLLGITFTFGKPATEGELPKPLITLTNPAEQQLGFLLANGYISNIMLLQQAAASSGFLNNFADVDGVVRRTPLLMRYGDALYPSLGLEATRLFLLADKIKLQTAPYRNTQRVEAVQLGQHIIPVDAQGRVIIPFRGRNGTFPYLSATDILNKKISAKEIQGKLVFIGTSAVGMGDLQTTAIQSAYPGVEIHAAVADGILTDNFSYKPSWAQGAEITLTVILGLILIFLFPYLGPSILGALTIVIPVVLIFVNNIIWEKTGLILSVLIPVLFVMVLAMTNMIYGYLFESRRREHLKQIFGQYVPPGHIDNMLKSRGNYGLLGEDREMTVLFADIRNFTTISEPMKVTELKVMLNEFFTPMTRIIFDNRGTIDKYVGDMIMAFWGAPLQDADHAKHAIEAALNMLVMVKKLKPIFAERGWPEVNIGIGLNSGSMSVGDMGSEFRRNYTVLGDAVNLGSRLEGLTKYYGVGLMVSERTRAGQEDFLFRLLDRVKVKGKRTGMAVYEPVCRRSESTEELQKEIQLHEQALDHYFAQHWDEAHKLFAQLSALRPDVLLYRMYLERIAEFRLKPPAPDWDGVYEHLKK